MSFRCVGDRLLVKVLEQKKESAGGILLPESKTVERPHEGEVVATDGKTDKFKIGDIVCFGKYAGIKVRDLNGDERLSLQHDEILGFDEP